MGLQKCANTHVDDWHLRGFSGGEKCRFSSAFEILTHLHLLFLDEPMYSTNKTRNFAVVGLYCLLVFVVATMEETSAIVTTTRP